MNRRLRIGVAVDYLPTEAKPYRGAANHQRLNALAKFADVRAYCLEPRYPRIFSHSRDRFNDRSGTPREITGVAVEQLRYGAIPLLTRALNGWRCVQVMLPRLQEFRPDVLMGYFVYPMGFAAVAAGLKLRVPAIVTAVGSDLRRMNGILVNPIISQALRRAAFVVTVSEELRQRATARGVSPERCRTIRHGCDAEIFHPGKREAARAKLQVPAEAELIVFVGSLLPLKGIRELLEATAVLATKRPRLRVVCIGEGRHGREFRERAEKPDLAGRVRFTGGASPEEVARWMRAANLFTLPSHSEGLPDVIIEALNCGRALVATDVGGIPEIVNSNCGILVPPKDSKRLEEALSEALDRKWDEEQVAATFRRSWDDWGREMYDVCYSVAREPAAV